MSQSKRTDELSVDDHVRFGTVIRTVTHTQTLQDRDILVVLDNGHADQYSPTMRWDVPTDEQIAAARAAERTEGTARALEHLAEVVRSHRLPAPPHTIDVTVVLDTVAELERWATALGREIENSANIPAVRGRNVAQFGNVWLTVRAQSMEKYSDDEQPDEQTDAASEPDEDGDGPVAGCTCEDCENLAAERAPESGVAS